MNIYFPDNIFSRYLASFFDDEEFNIAFAPSVISAKKLNDDKTSLALIPALELITNQELFISRSIGISFDGTLSNSYIYYSSQSGQINQVNITGDVSSMEVILCKILFKELYDADVKINVSTKSNEDIYNTLMVVGDNNFTNAKFEKGISFSEEIVELISAPYVNYIFASNNEDSLNNYLKTIETKIKEQENLIEDYCKNFHENSITHIRNNLKSVIFNLEEQDLAGINELIQLPYYHGLIKELFEIKFV